MDQIRIDTNMSTRLGRLDHGLVRSVNLLDLKGERQERVSQPRVGREE